MRSLPTTGWDFRSQTDTRNRKRFGDDVCLLRLQPPGINLSHLDVKPITLAKLPPPSGKRCSIAGWGATYVSSYRISLNLTTNRPLHVKSQIFENYSMVKGELHSFSGWNCRFWITINAVGNPCTNRCLTKPQCSVLDSPR